MSHINVFASDLLNDVSSFDDGYGAFSYSLPEGYQYADSILTREYTTDGIYAVRTVYAYNTNAITAELNYFDGRVHTNYYSNVDNYFSIVPIGGLTNGLLTIDGETRSGVNTPDGIEEIIDEIFLQRLNENPVTRIINREDYGIYTNTYGLTYNPTNQIFESNLFGYYGIIFKKFTFDWEPPSSQVYKIELNINSNYTPYAGYNGDEGVDLFDPSTWYDPANAWLSDFVTPSGEILPVPDGGWYQSLLNSSGELPYGLSSVTTNYIYSLSAGQDVIIPHLAYDKWPESYLNGIGRPVNDDQSPSAILNKPAQITKLYALDRDTLIEITFFDSAVISNNGIENIFEQFNTYRPNILSANLPEQIIEESDADGDGLTDWYEINFSLTEPADMDSDDDGLTDGYEVNTSKTNPNKIDSDDDGLSDGSELFIHITHPNEGDTDNDGLMDGFEVNVLNSDPSESSSSFFTHTVTNTITNNVGGYTLSEMADLRYGSKMIEVSNNTANLTFRIDAVSNLESNWNPIMDITVPFDMGSSDIGFFRVRGADELTTNEVGGAESPPNMEVTPSAEMYQEVMNNLHEDFRNSTTTPDGGGFDENDSTQV